jgi:hypothetical protein
MKIMSRGELMLRFEPFEAQNWGKIVRENCPVLEDLVGSTKRRIE